MANIETRTATVAKATAKAVIALRKSGDHAAAAALEEVAIRIVDAIRRGSL
jgi:hypothetical protein